MATKPGIIYRMDWKTVKDNGAEFSMEVSIYDKSVQIDSITGEEIVIPMTPSGRPLKISTDKSEDKFTSIRSKTATLSFLNSDSVNFTTFSTGEDDRFSVNITCNSIPIFVGFLQMTDIREPFLTQKDQEVTLTAIDGLAFLKGQELTDFNGARPTGMNPIIMYVAWALRKTGLFANINVFNNIREEANPGRWQTTAQFTNPSTIAVPINYSRYFKNGHTVNISGSASNNGNKLITGVNEFLGLITTSSTINNEASGPTITFEDVSDGGCMYSTCFLDAKTFEDKIGTFLDCYTVLERILKRECFIEQFQGNWYIFRVKEFRNDFQQYKSQYDQEGSFNGFTSGINLEKAIGLQQLDSTGTPIPFPGSPDAISYFSQAETSRVNSRPTGSVKLTYPFELPLEVPCNVDFSHGAFTANLADETIEGITYNVKSFQTDDWIYEKKSPPVAQDSTSYTRKLFLNGYEKERFVRLDIAATNEIYFLRSNCKIPIDLKDKFDFSVSFRWSQDLGGAKPYAVRIAHIRLYGDDGTYWNYGAKFGAGIGWWQTVSNWSSADANFATLNFGVETSTTLTNWNDINFNVPAVPVSGNIEICLLNSANAANQSMDFTNLSFDYIPFISGYNKFTGQYNKTTRPGNYKSKLEDNVYMSGSPKKLFKGALHIKNYNTNTYILAGQFYDGQEFLYANDGRNHTMNYGELQVRSVHNQYRNADEVYQLTAQGLNGFNYIDLIHRVFNRDIEPNTNSNAFQLCWIDQDWRNSEWQAMMIRNFNSTIGFVNDDAFEFKYESS